MIPWVSEVRGMWEALDCHRKPWLISWIQSVLVEGWVWELSTQEPKEHSMMTFRSVGSSGLVLPTGEGSQQGRDPKVQEKEPLPGLCVRSGGAGWASSVQQGIRAWGVLLPASVQPAPCCVPAVVREQGPALLEILALPATLLWTHCHHLWTAETGQVLTFVCLQCCSFRLCHSRAQCWISFSALLAKNVLLPLPAGPSLLVFGTPSEQTTARVAWNL